MLVQAQILQETPSEQVLVQILTENSIETSIYPTEVLLQAQILQENFMEKPLPVQILRDVFRVGISKDPAGGVS